MASALIWQGLKNKLFVNAIYLLNHLWVSLPVNFNEQPKKDFLFFNIAMLFINIRAIAFVCT